MKGKAENHRKENKLYHHGKECLRFSFPFDVGSCRLKLRVAPSLRGSRADGSSEGSACSTVILD